MNDSIKKSCASLVPNQIRAFLTRHGWAETNYGNTGLYKYHNNTLDLDLILPKTKTGSDYDQAIYKVLKLLAETEDKDVHSIFKAIVNPNVDLLKFRFMGAIAESTSLPLDYAISSMKSIQDSLVYSACSEIATPQPFYPRKLKDAQAAVKRSRFGQTEAGSFIVTVEMPLERPLDGGIQQQALIPDATAPVGRRVITRIMNGLNTAQQSVISNLQVNTEQEFLTGLNANLAESLSLLSLEDTDTLIEVTPVWDIQYGAPRGIENTGSLILDRLTFQSLGSISSALRGQSYSHDIEVAGLVSSLSRSDFEEEDDDGGEVLTGERTITIRPINTDNLPCKSFRVGLNATDYSTACDFHKERVRISINGRLEKIGKTWTMTTYRNFSRIP